MKTIAVIDGNSLMHRAFHAVPPYMTTRDGQPTNACFGFIGMLLKLIDEFHPDGIICAFDAGIPEFRMEALKNYKAQRPPTDTDLKSQFPLIKHLIESMAIPVICEQGWEGDDILGTIARQAEQVGVNALLITGDKDALQLASETTSIVTTKKGLSDVVVYGPDEVFERYGVTPAQVPDYLGLKGDTSDNIPGVPGVGEKTATKLLQEYGSLEQIVAHADDLKGKLAQSVKEHTELAYASRTVATIVCDVPIEIDFATLVFPDFDEEVVRTAFGILSFTAHLSKVLALQGGSVSSGSEGDGAGAVLEPRFTSEDAFAFIERAITGDELLAVAVDAGTGVSLFGDAKELAVAGAGGVAVFAADEVQNVLVRLVRSARIVVHDSKKMLQEIIPPDSSLPQQLSISEVDHHRIFDLSLAAYLLDSSRSDYSLTHLSEQYLSVIMSEPDDTVSRGVVSAAYSFALYDIMDRALEDDDSRACYDTIEMPLVPVLVQMERLGMNIDVTVLEELSHSMGDTIDRLRSEIYELADGDFNLDSPKQLGAILFEKLGLPAKKKTRSGYSTDAAVLAELSVLHPLPALMLEYRELAKMRSTYLDALPRLLGGDGRIHSSFNQTVAATGRLSSSDPNLQNIPVRTDLGRQIRTAFIPDEVGPDGKPGAVFLGADYSQIELRLLAHLSQDEGLIEAFGGGRDFHTSTAARVFGVEPDQVTPELRSRAKAVNFGIVYGQQAYGLSQSLKIPFTEAQEMIDRYFDAYPQVRRYLDDVIAQAKVDGWVSTLCGRKRHIRELASSNPAQRSFGERTAMNHPMQGAAADIIKLAMIEIDRRLNEDAFTAQMVLQVHDELDFICPQGEIERLSQMVTEVMEGVVDLCVPLEVSVSYGANWAEAK